VTASCGLVFLFGDYSPASTTAPSLRAARLERLPDKVLVSSGPSPSSRVLLFSGGGGRNYSEWPVLPHFGPLLRARYIFPFRRGPSPPQCPVFDLS
jgi:hypothetical protein